MPVFSFSGLFAAQLALCQAHAGHLDEAQRIVGRFLDARRIGDADDQTRMPILVALLEAAVLIGDEAATRRLVGPLEVAANLVAVDNSITIVARHLGAAMRLLGHPESALAYTRQAIEVARRVNFRPELALARLQLAEIGSESVDGELITELASTRIQPKPSLAQRALGV
jgi:ATP/maltotriose-dependent transcriptional regulator MalT